MKHKNKENILKNKIMEISLLNKDGKPTDELTLKEVITAEMKVEFTKIFRKYAKLYDDFRNMIMQEETDINSLSDEDFLRAIRIQKHPNEPYKNIFYIYGDVINREIIPLFADISSIKNKSFLEMINNPDNELWKKQDTEAIEVACQSFREKIL